METTIVYLGYMETLQCSSFLGLVWFLGLGFLLGLPKRYYIGGSRYFLSEVERQTRL